jgi:precorrin-6A/cobalt-precorrin-6A reductase
MRLLILGGTADGRQLAETLHNHGLPLIYSVAGLVRTPKVECEVVSGGFSQFGGLVEYSQQHAITAILDVTHPYAAKMSATAVSAAKSCGIPCWRFHRKPWEKTSADRWQQFSNWKDLIAALSNKKRLFLTVGQVEQGVLEQLASKSERVILRTAVAPKIKLPSNVEWIKAIGPFAEEDEYTLMQHYNIDALVSKNSGGKSTVAKLFAARKLKLSVYMLERPVLEAADKIFIDKKSCEQYVLKQFSHVVTKTR